MKKKEKPLFRKEQMQKTRNNCLETKQCNTVLYHGKTGMYDNGNIKNRAKSHDLTNLITSCHFS